MAIVHVDTVQAPKCALCCEDNDVQAGIGHNHSSDQASLRKHHVAKFSA